MELSGYIHTCAAGETFDRIAYAEYGKETYAVEILSVNPEHCGTLVFSGGEKIRLPVIDIPQETDTPTAAKAPWK